MRTHNNYVATEPSKNVGYFGDVLQKLGEFFQRHLLIAKPVEYQPSNRRKKENTRRYRKILDNDRAEKNEYLTISYGNIFYVVLGGSHCQTHQGC